MNDYLPEILGSIDERLLNHLNNDGEMLVESVHRLRLYTTALLGGSITPIAIAEDWEDYYHLLPCFTMVYAPEWIGTWRDRRAF